MEQGPARPSVNRGVLVGGGLLTIAMIAVFVAVMGKDPQHIESPLIGRPAPPFALRAVGSSDVIDLENLRGKPVVLNFWATWCRPCYQEHPVLVENARLMGSEVHFVGIVFDDRDEKILEFLRERGSSYPTLVDEKGKTAIAYGVGGVPETFFLDAQGRIVSKFEGPLTSDALQARLARASRP